MDQQLIKELDEYLALNFIQMDSSAYYEYLNTEEVMRRLRIQARLRLKRTMAITEFGIDQGTFGFLVRSYNKKRIPLDTIWIKSKAPNSIVDKLKTDAGFKPPVPVLMRVLLALQLSEMDANNMLSEGEMSFRPYEYLDLIIAFALRNRIYELDEVNQLLKYKGVNTL